MQAKAHEAASTSRKRRWGDDRAGLPVSERSGHDLDADAAVVRDRNRTQAATRAPPARYPCEHEGRARYFAPQETRVSPIAQPTASPATVAS